MAAIACVVNGLTGILFACLEMARRLDAAGGEVLIAAPEAARGQAEAAGFAFRPLPEARESHLETGVHASFMADLPVDLALVDVELPELILGGATAGVPMAQLNIWMSIWAGPGAPPLHTGVRPGVGVMGRPLGVRAAWLAHRIRREARDRWRALRAGGRDRLTRLSAYADGVGIDPRAAFDRDGWLLPFSFRSLPALVLHARAFDFAPPTDDRIRYVGPMVLERRPEPVDGAAAVDAAIARRKGGVGRLIYGGFGSFFTVGSDILTRLDAAFARRPDWTLILPLGPQVDAARERFAAPNIIVTPWAPQLRALAAADAALVHGGINTIDECVHTRTPMAAYSGGLTDMPGNIARVVHHGVGVAGDVRRDDPDTIVARLEAVMGDAAIAGALAAQQAAAAAYRRERTLERTVEALLDGELAAATRALSPPGAGPQGATPRI